MPQTGPRTTAGKAKSRANAVKHGLRAASPVVRPIESETDWKRHLEGVIESLDPDGYLESELATRVADVLWRLRRVGYYEGEQISLSLEEMPGEVALAAEYGERVTGIPVMEQVTREKMDKMIGARLFPPGYIIDHLMRYEAHLHRQYIQTLHELEAIQARRNGQHTPLARLDITGSPS